MSQSLIANIDSESGDVSSGPPTGLERSPIMLIGPDIPYVAHTQVSGADPTI